MAKEKEFKIIVNGRPRTWEDKKITFEQVLALALDPVPQGENWVFTVTYRKGPEGSHEGSLTAGKHVNVKDDMVFNVTATDKS